VVHDMLPLALRGVEHNCDVEELPRGPGLATSELVDEGVQVVPFWNVEMALLSVASGISVQRLEKHRMYSCRLSPSRCLQFCSSHYLPGRVYVHWKFPTKIQRRPVQLLILSWGRCSSHVCAESPR
jgi:hypothetical protein